MREREKAVDGGGRGELKRGPRGGGGKAHTHARTHVSLSGESARRWLAARKASTWLGRRWMSSGWLIGRVVRWVRMI